MFTALWKLFHSTAETYCEDMEFLPVSGEVPLHRFRTLVKHWLGRRWLLLVLFLQEGGVDQKQWGKVRGEEILRDLK